MIHFIKMTFFPEQIFSLNYIYCSYLFTLQGVAHLGGEYFKCASIGTQLSHAQH